jgi:hypothetical protein
MTTVHYILFAWPVLVVLLFPCFRKRQAVIAAFMVGVLFLPQVEWAPEDIPGPKPIAYPGFEFGKKNVISYAILLALLIHDPRRLFSFRPRWFDLPMLAWCLCPFFSCLENEIGVGAAFSQTRDQTLEWGVPYFVARIYFSDGEGFRVLMIGILLGALVYVPLCLYEVKMSPQLHRTIYGFYQHEFLQTVRQGGYRPMVFLKHGLAVGSFMDAGTLIAWWLWWAGTLRSLRLYPGARPVSAGWLVLVLLGTTVLSRSTGALALGLAGATVLCLTRLLGLRLVMLALIAIAPVYIADRVSGRVFGENIVAWLKTNFSKERASSYEYRLINENLLMDKAFQKPVFGWSGWGRSRVTNEKGQDIAVTDGLWIITVGCWGFAGLILLYLAMLLPVVRFLWLHPPAQWSHPLLAPAAVASLIVVIHMIDNLLNGMPNPAYMLMAAGVAGLAGTRVTAPAPAEARTPREQIPVPYLPVSRRRESARPGVIRRLPAFAEEGNHGSGS